MTSQVEVVNLALTKLGAARITAITDASKSARVMSSLWSVVRRAELRRALWSFALRRTALPALSDAPAFGFARAFQLPADYLRLVQVGQTYVSPSQTDYVTGDNSPWAIEAGQILTDFGAPLQIRYVGDVEDTGTFDALFVQCFASALAYEACEEITNSTAKRQMLAEDYKAQRRDAVATGAIERPPESIADDSWMLGRL